MSWQDQAACADRDPREFVGSTRADVYPPTLRALCFSCPVQTECLRWAIEHNELGLWGGTDEEQRMAWRKAAGLSYQLCPRCGELVSRYGVVGGRVCCAECSPRQEYWRQEWTERKARLAS